MGFNIPVVYVTGFSEDAFSAKCILIGIARALTFKELKSISDNSLQCVRALQIISTC